ncbi:MAG: hypothetical protein SNJ72_00480 [Fimbriimonadales bacterium]
MKRVWMIGLLSLMLAKFGVGAETRELVLFPFNLEGGVTATEDFNVGAEVLNALYAQVKDVPNLYVFRYRETNPSVRRAVEENRLRRDRLTPPFNVREPDGTWRSARIAQIMDSDFALAGSIAEFRFNPETREAVITLSVDLVQASDGAVLASLAETGRGRLGSDEQDVNLAYIRAISEATEKVGAALRERLAPPQEEAAPEPDRRRNRGRDRAAVTLFTLLVGVGLRLFGF